MELTRERIEIYANAEWTKPEIRSMAKQLLAEMDKPKVWDGAPDYAGRATVTFEKGGSDNTTIWSKVYTRELPKTRIDEIAEDFAEMACLHGELTVPYISEYIKSAIIKHDKEREANR